MLALVPFLSSLVRFFHYSSLPSSSPWMTLGAQGRCCGLGQLPSFPPLGSGSLLCPHSRLRGLIQGNGSQQPLSYGLLVLLTAAS